ncbi:carbon-nitrogen hydrolase family protein [Paenirhodobacter sp.]|uniref:carbon-nitrogen hydrolase family protein n=1 Tax=Paenirhodobacter sp. TaxID=1965326 RepID=UPI003B3CC933
MKLVLSQPSPTNGDTEAAFGHVAMLLRMAGAAGAEMVLLPELFLPGYNRPDLHAGAQGPWIARLREMARAAGVGLTLGWAERAGEDVYNAATAIGPDGAVLAHYRKIQLFGPMERASFRPGTAPPPVFDLNGRRFGLLICYDIEFAAHSAALAQRGAEIILVPTANPAGFEHVQEVLVPARAHESALTVAYANYCGTETGLAFGGRSLIAGPDARPLAAAGTGETVLIATLPRREDYPPALISTQARDFRAP